MAEAEDAELAALLREQEEFLRSNKPAAARAIRKRPPPIGTSSAPPPQTVRHPCAPDAQGDARPGPSRNLERKDLHMHGEKDVVQLRGFPVLNPDAAFLPKMQTTMDPGQLLDEFDERTSLPAVLQAEVLERRLVVGTLRRPESAGLRGFPQAQHRRSIPDADGLAAKKVVGRSKTTQRQGSREVDPAHGGDMHDVLGKGVRAEIHAENLNKLRSMGTTEIKQAKEKLLQTLDPGIVQRLTRGRTANQDSSQQTRSASQPEPSSKGPQASQVDVPTSLKPFKVVVNEVEGAAQTLEQLKMEWMENANSMDTQVDGNLGLPRAGHRSVEEALVAAAQEVGMHLERFGFDGNLIGKEMAPEIPVHLGLHHHGDQPNAPGYTLAELMRLSRSAVPAQRVQALRILATIFAKQRGSLRRRVAKWCVDAHVAVLIRVALDDNAVSAQHAALEAAAALATLLGAPPISVLEAECGRAQLCWRGAEGIFLGTTKVIANANSEVVDSQETDADACRRDVLAGWVRMGLISRLRYLMQMGELPSASILAALDLLCQCAGHSSALASDVVRCPHLLETLKGLLDGSQPSTSISRRALMLVQLLASSSSASASTLLSQGVLIACNALVASGFCLKAIALQRDEAPSGLWACTSSSAEVELSASALGVWRTFVAYSMAPPSLDLLFPLISQATHAPRGNLSCASFLLLETLCHSPFSAQWAAEVPAAIDDAGILAPVVIQDAEYAHSDPITSELSGHVEMLVTGSNDGMHHIDAREHARWRNLSIFIPAALSLLAQELHPTGSVTSTASCAIGALHFLASYCENLSRVPMISEETSLQWAERVFHGHLLPFCCSTIFEWAIDTVKAQTVAAPDAQLHGLELLLGFLRLLLNLTRHHRGLVHKFTASELSANKSRDVASLLWSLAKSLPSWMEVLFSRSSERSPLDSKSWASHRRGLLESSARVGYSLACLVDSLSMYPKYDMMPRELSPQERGQLFLQLVASSISCVQCSDESLAFELMGKLLLDLRWVSLLDSDMARTLHDVLLPPFLQLLELEKRESQKPSKSTLQQSTRLKALRISCNRSPLPLNSDWLTAPLHYFGTNQQGDLHDAAVVSQVRASLQLLLHIHSHAPLRWLDPSRRLCRALQVFTLPACPWRDAAISALLDQLLHAWGYQSTEVPALLGSERTMDSLGLLQDVLAVYSSESFGDPCFTHWVLLALRRDEPQSLQVTAWQVLEETAHKIVVASPPAHALPAWRQASSPSSPADPLLEAFEISLRQGRLSQAPRASFLYQLAIQRLSSAAFGDSIDSSNLLARLLLKLPPHTFSDLCIAPEMSPQLNQIGAGVLLSDSQKQEIQRKREKLHQLCEDMPEVRMRLHNELSKLSDVLQVDVGLPNQVESPNTHKSE